MSSRFGSAQWPETSLLGCLGQASREALLKAGTPVSYPRQRTIIRQGDVGNHALLLLGGYVKVIANDETGHETLLEIRVGGDLVGEMAVLDHKPRLASVVTCVECRANIITRAELERLVEQNSEISLQLARMFSERLRWSSRRRIDFATHDASTRVARVLVEIAQTYGRAVVSNWEAGLPLTQAEVASIAGVGLGTVEKTLLSLQQQGAVRRRYRRIEVLDMDRLRKIAAMNDENPY